MKREKLRSDLEAILFVWGSPVDAGSAAAALDIGASEAESLFEELRSEYDARGGGLMIRKIEKKYQICTRPECEEAIRAFCTPVRTKRLSNAALEVLAVIAYRQPVSRSEIDAVRGIKSERVIEGLIRRELVEEKGRGSGLGRPILYGTTPFFLEKFGISSLEELPDIEDIASLSDGEETRREAGGEPGQGLRRESQSSLQQKLQQDSQQLSLDELTV